jgi:hypothetical protein
VGDLRALHLQQRGVVRDRHDARAHEGAHWRAQPARGRAAAGA